MLLKRKYVPLSKTAIRAEQPLLFPVYNKGGYLLADKGLSLSQKQVDRLLSEPEIFTLDRSMTTAALGRDYSREENNVYQLPPPLKRLESIEKILYEIYYNPGSATTLSKILTLVSRLQTICEKSPDASIAKILTDDQSNYAVKHALHTAILCELTSTYLKWPLEKRRNLVAAALTMNISLGMLQNELLDQAQPLTVQQQEIIHDHPEESVKLLRSAGVQNAEWLEYVEKHHEAVDGSGYPKQLFEDEIPMGAIIISLSDIYCALVSGRTYREPIFANIAARNIFLEKDESSKDTLIEVFVKILSLYPPGCIVRLINEELAVVIKRGERVDTPVVQLISTTDPTMLDKKIKRQTAQKPYRIKSIIPSNSLQIDINYDQIWKV